MKLFKKLIPIAPFIAIAPIVASCGSAANQDITDYQPAVEQHKSVSTSWTNKHAGEYYFENDNLGQIFKDDVYYWLSKEIKIGNLSSGTTNINKMKAGVGNVNAAKRTVQSTITYMLSYDLDLDLSFEYKGVESGFEYTFDCDATIGVRARNIPYVLQSNGQTNAGEYIWLIKPYYDSEGIDYELWNNISPNWSMSASLNGNAKLNNVALDLNASGNFSNSSTDEEKGLFEWLASILGKMNSHHLALVKSAS